MMTDDRITIKAPANRGLAKWLPLLTEIWISLVLVAFVIIRVLGSNTAKHLFPSMGQ